MKKKIEFLVEFIKLPIKVLALIATNCVEMDLKRGRVLYNLNGDEARLVHYLSPLLHS